VQVTRSTCATWHCMALCAPSRRPRSLPVSPVTTWCCSVNVDRSMELFFHLSAPPALLGPCCSSGLVVLLGRTCGVCVCLWCLCVCVCLGVSACSACIFLGLWQTLHGCKCAPACHVRRCLHHRHSPHWLPGVRSARGAVEAVNGNGERMGAGGGGLKGVGSMTGVRRVCALPLAMWC
jgi:hypothetical protein